MCWSWNLLKQATWSWRGSRHPCSSAWTARATWADRYSKHRRAHSKTSWSSRVTLPTPHTSSPSFRGSTWRRTAPSESCCWQTDTPASCPRTTGPLCLWHPNSPPAVTRSPSRGSYRSGIPWQWRARLISHQTTIDFSTWTLTIFWGWLWIAWSVLSSQRKSEGNQGRFLFSRLNLQTWFFYKCLDFFGVLLMWQWRLTYLFIVSI